MEFVSDFPLWNKQSVLKSLPFNSAKIFHGTGTPDHRWKHQRNLFESSVQTPCQCSHNSPLKLKLGNVSTKRCHYTTKTKKHIYLVSCISCFWRGDGWISLSSAHTNWVSSILCFYLKTVIFLKEFIINSFTRQEYQLLLCESHLLLAHMNTIFPPIFFAAAYFKISNVRETSLH
jgi:hypothetical protein